MAKKQKKFDVTISTVEGACKRSVSMQQIETLFLASNSTEIIQKQKSFDIRFSFTYGEFNKSVRVKKLPLSYIKKFQLC